MSEHKLASTPYAWVKAKSREVAGNLIAQGLTKPTPVTIYTVHCDMDDYDYEICEPNEMDNCYHPGAGVQSSASLVVKQFTPLTVDGYCNAARAVMENYNKAVFNPLDPSTRNRTWRGDDCVKHFINYIHEKAYWRGRQSVDFAVPIIGMDQDEGYIKIPSDLAEYTGLHSNWKPRRNCYNIAALPKRRSKLPTAAEQHSATAVKFAQDIRTAVEAIHTANRAPWHGDEPIVAELDKITSYAELLIEHITGEELKQ